MSRWTTGLQRDHQQRSNKPPEHELACYLESVRNRADFCIGVFGGDVSRERRNTHSFLISSPGSIWLPAWSQHFRLDLNIISAYAPPQVRAPTFKSLTLQSAQVDVDGGGGQGSSIRGLCV